MKAKKFISILLVGVLSIAGFAACGNTKEASTTGSTAESVAASSAETSGSSTVPAPADGDKVIRVAWWGNQIRNDNTVNTLNLYSEQNPGVAFETEFSDWTGYWDKMATQAAASSLPDIIQQDYKYYKQYQAKGQLASLNEFVDSGILNLADAPENIIESGKVGNDLYALCLGINAPAMVYDPEAAAAAGVEIKNGMTREEFLDAAEKIFANSGKKYDWGYADGENYIEYMMRGEGKVLFQDGKLGIDGPEDVVPYFQLFQDGVASAEHLTAEELNEAVGVGIEQDPLSLGTSWMALVYSNQVIAFKDAAQKELSMVSWPVGSSDTAKAMYLKPSQFFSVTESSAHKEESAKVLDFFTNSVEANKILKAERGVPISSVVAEAIKPEVSESDRYVFDYIQEVEPLTSTINPPSPEGMGEVLSLINDLTEQVAYANMTAEEAAAKFFTDANAILAKSLTSAE